jgi:hypothetical protein
MDDEQWINSIVEDEDNDPNSLDDMMMMMGIDQIEAQRRKRMLLLMEIQEAQQRREILATQLFSLYIIIGKVRSYLTDHYNIPRNPFHTQEGIDYVKRLLDSSLPDQVHNCRKIYRMDQEVFRNFCSLLRSSGHVKDSESTSVEGKFTMFLLTVGQDQRYGVTSERFRCSNWSVSVYFNEILEAIMRLSPTLLAKHTTTTPTRIRDDRNVYPYFKVCFYYRIYVCIVHMMKCIMCYDRTVLVLLMGLM